MKVSLRVVELTTCALRCGGVVRDDVEFEMDSGMGDWDL